MNKRNKIKVGIFGFAAALIGVCSAVKVNAQAPVQNLSNISSSYWDDVSQRNEYGAIIINNTYEDDLKILGFDIKEFDNDSYYFNEYNTSVHGNVYDGNDHVLLGVINNSHYKGKNEVYNFSLYFYTPDYYFYNSLENFQLHYTINGKKHHALIETVKSEYNDDWFTSYNDHVFGMVDSYGSTFEKTSRGFVEPSSYESSLNWEDDDAAFVLPYSNYRNIDEGVYGVERIDFDLFCDADDIWDENGKCNLVIDGYSYYNEADIYGTNYLSFKNLYTYCGYEIIYDYDLGIVQGGINVNTQIARTLTAVSDNVLLKDFVANNTSISQETTLHEGLCEVETVSYNWKNKYSIFSGRTRYYECVSFVDMVDMTTGNRILNASSLTFIYSYKGKTYSKEKNVFDLSNLGFWEGFSENNNYFKSSYIRLVSAESMGDDITNRAVYKNREKSFDPGYYILFGNGRTSPIKDCNIAYVWYEVAGSTIQVSFYEDGLHARYDTNGNFIGIFDINDNYYPEYSCDENGVIIDFNGKYIPIEGCTITNTIIENEPFPGISNFFKRFGMGISSLISILKISAALFIIIIFILLFIKLIQLFKFKKN